MTAAYKGLPRRRAGAGFDEQPAQTVDNHVVNTTADPQPVEAAEPPTRTALLDQLRARRPVGAGAPPLAVEIADGGRRVGPPPATRQRPDATSDDEFPARYIRDGGRR